MAEKGGGNLGGPKGINLGVYGGFNLLQVVYNTGENKSTIIDTTPDHT